MKISNFFKKKQAGENTFVPLFSRFLSSIGIGNRQNNADYYTSWVATCIRAIAEPVASIELELFKVDSDGEKTDRIQSHPVLTLLHDINNFMTFFDVMERLQSNIELQGNEYWFLAYGDSKEPQAIFPLLPQFVKVVPDPETYVKEYVYTVGGKEYKIPRANIIHYKTYNPNSDIIGIGTLEASKTAAETDHAAAQYNKKYFQNSGRPDVVLKYPETLDPDQEKRLLQAWQQNHGGPDRNFRTAVASGGLEITAFQSSQRDMEFLGGRNFNRDEILAIFRVPPTIIGMSVQTSFAAAKAVNYSYMKNTIEPKMQRIINVLNEFLLPLYPDGDSLIFEFADPAIEDEDLLIKRNESGIKNGYLSINDVRRSEGLPEIQGGESVYIPFNVQPLGEPVKSVKVRRETPLSKDIATAVKNMFSDVKDVIVTDNTEEEKPKTEEELKAEKFERDGEMRVKKKQTEGLQFENQFNRILAELWDEQKNDAINALKAFFAKKDAGKVSKASQPTLIDPELQIEATIDLFTPLFTSITEAEGLSAAEFIGILGDEAVIAGAELQKFVTENTHQFSKEVTKVTSNKLRADVAAGLAAGEGLSQITQRIEGSTAFNKFRAEKIARTETIRAQNRAEIEVWKQSGVVSAKVWYTAQDERTCPFCEPLHGKVFTLNKDVFPKGESLTATDPESGNSRTLNLDYDNVEGPPLHPQCRCALIPVIE